MGKLEYMGYADGIWYADGGPRHRGMHAAYGLTPSSAP